ncbi:hypothetical protein C8Q76DRAFT_391651 [Earliella scabrosa]|nr:hypothetical protein C8Q76DRAFT_391651 [Earliella scabrosa]
MRLSSLNDTLEFLRKTNASLAREVRAGSIARPSTVTVQPLPLKPHLASRFAPPPVAATVKTRALKRQLENVANLMIEIGKSLRSDIRTESRRSQDMIANEMVLAATREGMAQAWRAQTTKELARLSENAAPSRTRRPSETWVDPIQVEAERCVVLSLAVWVER